MGSAPVLDGAAATPVTHIKPVRGWRSLDLRELWEYRDLLTLLAWRDIKVRYRQTLLGAAWAVLQPLLTMAVFSLFFGRLAKVPSDNLPYPIFAFAALVPWGFFSTSLAQSTNSLVGNANLLKKVYFPRLVIPVSCSASALVDMGFAFTVLLGFMVWYRVVPTPNVLWLPLLVMLALVTSLGAGLWLAALSVRYRDVRYIVPFLMQFWLFATPIAYPSSLLPEPWRTLYGLTRWLVSSRASAGRCPGAARPPGRSSGHPRWPPGCSFSRVCCTSAAWRRPLQTWSEKRLIGVWSFAGLRSREGFLFSPEAAYAAYPGMFPDAFSASSAWNHGLARRFFQEMV